MLKKSLRHLHFRIDYAYNKSILGQNKNKKVKKEKGQLLWSGERDHCFLRHRWSLLV